MGEHLKILLTNLSSREELEEAVKLINKCLFHTFKRCFDFAQNVDESHRGIKVLEIDSIVDQLHDELHTGHWSKVPMNVLRAFTAASYLKALIHLKLNEKSVIEGLKDCLKCLDMGVLLGAPLKINSRIMVDSTNYVAREINRLEKEMEGDLGEVSVSNCHLKRKHPSEDLEKLETAPGKIVDVLDCPSLETFNNKYFLPQVPLKLKDCMTHWPASIKWLDVNYLLDVVGDRTVPIEVGSHYVDDDWHQKLMTFKEFIKQHYLSDSKEIGYLAQHNLFNQVPELEKDICIPEYCCLTNSENEEESEPTVNAWLGPEGTVSPMHFDPKNNILCQVFGTKLIFLCPPSDSVNVYPYEGKLLSNTAAVDPSKPDFVKYPNFKNATLYKCLLEPGEMLFIPVKWWHYVMALDKSFSVSFWWK